MYISLPTSSGHWNSYLDSKGIRLLLNTKLPQLCFEFHFQTDYEQTLLMQSLGMANRKPDFSTYRYEFSSRSTKSTKGLDYNGRLVFTSLLYEFRCADAKRVCSR